MLNRSLKEDTPIDESGWYSYRRYRNPLQGKIKTDVLIIGGGPAGLAAARRALTYDKDVVLLEAREVGSGGIGNSTGVVTSSGGFELDLCEAVDRFGERLATEIWNYSERGARILYQEIKMHGIECNISEEGCLYLMAEKCKKLETEFDLQQKRGPVYKITGLRKIREFVNTDFYPSALWYPHTEVTPNFTVDPLALVRGLAETAERKGVKIYENTPAIRMNGKNNTVETPKGEVRFEKVIIATNPYTTDLKGIQRSVQRTVIPIYQYVSLVSSSDSPIKPGLGFWTSEDADYAYGVGIDNKRFMASNGAIEFVAARAPSDPRNYKPVMEETLSKRFPDSDMYIEKIWGGRLGEAPSIVPLMGRVGDNIYITMIGDGIATAYHSGFTAVDAAFCKGKVPSYFDINHPGTFTRMARLAPRRMIDSFGPKMLEIMF